MPGCVNAPGVTKSIRISKISNGHTNIAWREELNLIGSRFLARHLVNFDFSEQTMYLKQTSSGPLDDENAEAAAGFLKT